MDKQKIYKIVTTAVTTLRLRLNTIRDYIARMNSRLALRFPPKCKIFGDPMVILITIIVICLAIAWGLSSCNVTRTITTQSQYYQRGDTTCTIVTKTIETYDASKKL